MQSTGEFDRDSLVTVYFQGNQAARYQACKYAGSAGVDVAYSDGGETRKVHHFEMRQTPPLLHNLYCYEEWRDLGRGWSWNPLHWFFKLMQWLTMWYYGVTPRNLPWRCVPHNYVTEYDVAGREDVSRACDVIAQCIRENPEKRLVLFGTSRGAATMLVAIRKLSNEERSHIALAIAEAPFDSVPSVLATYWTGAVIHLLLRLFTRYRLGQQSPRAAVCSEDFPLDVPLAFVTSRQDTVVPPRLTQLLIDLLRARKHTALHHLELANSGHSLMACGDPLDRAQYLTFVNDLYARYVPKK